MADRRHVAGDGRARRRRRLRALLDATAPARIAAVRDGRGPRRGRGRLRRSAARTALERPCVFWHTVDVGPAIREHERSGGNVVIGDESGQACVDFASEVIFIRSDNYREIAGPDWALHLETSLARGESLHVAGPVTVTSDPSAGAPYRGGLSPVFAGRPGRRSSSRRATRSPSGPSCASRPRSPGPWSRAACSPLSPGCCSRASVAPGFVPGDKQTRLRPGPLGLVHRRVGRRDERVRVVYLAFDGGADADRDRDDLARVLEAVLLDRLAQALAQRLAPSASISRQMTANSSPP